MSDGPRTTPSEETAPNRATRPRGGGAPDAATRMLVTTIAITAVIAAGVFAWRTLRDGDDTGSTAEVEWDEVALVDRRTGTVTTYGADGERLAETPGNGRVTAVHAHHETLALVGATTIVLTDATGDGDPTVIEIPRGSTVSPIATAATSHLLVGTAAGGNLLVVDVADGSVIDVGEAAAPTVPKLYADTVQVNTEGTRFAVADAANFQTIVVGEGIDGAAFLADQPVAVGDELVATSQVVNLQADISLVDLERRSQAVVPTELPRGGVMVEDELVMVSVDGGVFRVGPGDREAERIGSVAVPTGGSVAWARPAALGERLVVGGAGFVAVVDLDGGTLFTTTFVTPDEPLPPHPAWRCLPVAADVGHSIVDLASGEQVADLTGLTITAVAADGCTVIGERDGVLELVDGAGRVELGAHRDADLAPDGDSVVWTTTTGRVELVAVDAELDLGEPIELVDPPTNLTVAFLRR